MIAVIPAKAGIQKREQFFVTMGKEPFTSPRSPLP